MTQNTGTKIMLTQDEVAERYRISKQSLWRWRKAGAIPEPLIVGGKAVRWPLQVLLDWEAKGCPRREKPSEEGRR